LVYPRESACIAFLIRGEISYAVPSTGIWIDKEIFTADKEGDTRGFTRILPDLVPIRGNTNLNAMAFAGWMIPD
jgi:hypothetical protein